MGEKEPNVWGLYDVLGNAEEWTEDDWHDDYTGAPNGGSAWVDTPRAARRVVRGGSFNFSEGNLRAARRYGGSPVNRFGHIGFRVVVSPSSSDSGR